MNLFRPANDNGIVPADRHGSAAGLVASHCSTWLGFELSFQEASMNRTLHTTLLAAILALGCTGASAAPIAFRSAKATFVQHQAGYDFSPATMIDGITTGQNGWAISTLASGEQTRSQTALLTLDSPLDPAAKTITFKIYQNWGSAETLGNFSLGYTAVATPALAGHQTPFRLLGFSATDGATLTSPGAGHLVAGGDNPATAVYTITVAVDAPVTGIYLNAINDPHSGFATGGPGRSNYGDGNFVITELTASTSTDAGAN
jgi:hypothetical protein